MKYTEDKADELKMDDSLTGYVKVERKGDLIHTGTRTERITRHGERVLEAIDGEETCSWVRKFRGTIRYSPLHKSEEVLRSKVINNKIEGQYLLMPTADTYAEGVHALREACKKDKGSPHPQYELYGGRLIYRPLMIGENLAARLQDSFLFNQWLNSCTAIVYKKKSTLFKIVPMCKKLITIPKRFKKSYLGVNYDDYDYEEFDSSKVKCDVAQSRQDAKQDPLLITSVGGDKDLLGDYVDSLFDRLNERGVDMAMRFIVKSNTNEDELRALCVDDLNFHSDVVGIVSLFDGGSFLRVAQ